MVGWEDKIEKWLLTIKQNSKVSKLKKGTAAFCSILGHEKRWDNVDASHKHCKSMEVLCFVGHCMSSGIHLNIRPCTPSWLVSTKTKYCISDVGFRCSYSGQTVALGHQGSTWAEVYVYDIRLGLEPLTLIDGKWWLGVHGPSMFWWICVQYERISANTSFYSQRLALATKVLYQLDSDFYLTNSMQLNSHSEAVDYII